MVNISDSVKRKINRIVAEVAPDEDIDHFLDKISMTDLPKDDYLTKVVLKRAAFEAQNIDDDFYCFVCGEKFNHPDEFIKHYQKHLEDFMAGMPIQKTDEHIELQIQNLHPKHREDARKFLKKVREEGISPPLIK